MTFPAITAAAVFKCAGNNQLTRRKRKVKKINVEKEEGNEVEKDVNERKGERKGDRCEREKRSKKGEKDVNERKREREM